MQHISKLLSDRNQNERERIMTDIVNDIVKGDFDNHLDEIANAIHNRRDIVNRIKTISIPIGATVKFNDKINPKYLKGQEVTVKKVNKKTVVCDFPINESFKRFSGAANVKVPTSTIDIVEYG
jgi:hypothetical protein